MDHLKRCKTSNNRRGTQHFTGTVSNEATSEMGYPAWPAGRTCQFFPEWEEAQPKNLHVGLEMLLLHCCRNLEMPSFSDFELHQNLAARIPR